MKKYLFIFAFIAFLPSVIHGRQATEVAAGKVRTALLKQLEIYPQSRLSDIYKFFFQDKFGPGHLLSDTAQAGAYIRSELAQMKDVTHSPDIDSIGWEQNFVRVNLVLVKRGVLSYGQLFRAFTESMKRELPDISGWREEWNAIRKIASGIRVKRVGGSVVPDENGERLCEALPGFREDERHIRQQLKRGRYVGHHSDAFEKAYAPHYRIVSKSIYERTIKPLLGREQGDLERLVKKVYEAFLLYTTGHPEIAISGHAQVGSGKNRYDYLRPIYPDSPKMKTPLDKIESLAVSPAS